MFDETENITNTNGGSTNITGADQVTSNTSDLEGDNAISSDGEPMDVEIDFSQARHSLDSSPSNKSDSNSQQENHRQSSLSNELYDSIHNGSLKIDLPKGWLQAVFSNCVGFTISVHEFTPTKRLATQITLQKQVNLKCLIFISNLLTNV